MKIETRGLPNNTWFGMDKNWHAWNSLESDHSMCGRYWIQGLVPASLWSLEPEDICEECYRMEIMRELAK